MAYVLLIIGGILVLAFLLAWGFLGALISIIGMLLPILAAVAIFYLVFKLIGKFVGDENPLFSPIGIAIFVLILWWVF